jgi:ankyrin repeat protein
MDKKLYEAIKNQSVSEVKKLIFHMIELSKNNDIYSIDEMMNYKDDKGRDCLQIAFNSKNKEIIQSIINFKLIDYHNWFNQKALIRSINVGTIDLIKLVLNCNIDVNQVNYSGENALMLAIKFNKNEAVDILLNSKININHKDEKGNNVLYLAFHHKNSLELISKLNKYGIHFDVTLYGEERSARNINPFLMVSYEEVNLNLLKHFIEENKINKNPIKLDSIDELGNNALFLSVYYAHVDKQEKFKFIYENIKEINKYQKNEIGQSLISFIFKDYFNSISLRKPIVEYLIEKQYFMSREFDVNEWDTIKDKIKDKELVNIIDVQIKTYQEKTLLENNLKGSINVKKSLKL